MTKLKLLDTPNLPQIEDVALDIAAWRESLDHLTTAKTKLSLDFTQALMEDFNQHGKQAIERVREENPDKYLRLIAGVMPKEVQIDVNKYSASSAQLADDSRLQFLRTLIAPSDGDGFHVDVPDSTGEDIQTVQPREGQNGSVLPTDDDTKP